jgi:hypothetical protein
MFEMSVQKKKKKKGELGKNTKIDVHLYSSKYVPLNCGFLSLICRWTSHVREASNGSGFSTIICSNFEKIQAGNYEKPLIEST